MSVTFLRSPSQISYDGGSWESYSGELDIGVFHSRAALAVPFSSAISVTGCVLRANVGQDGTNTVRCRVYSSPSMSTPLGTATVPIQAAGAVTFRFQSLSVSAETLYFLLDLTESQGSGGMEPHVWFQDVAADITANLPTLSIGASPASVAVGGSVTLSAENRLSEALNVTLKYGSATLKTLTMSADSASVECPASWYDKSGATGTSMRVSIEARDSYGRTASNSFSLTRPALGLSVSPAFVYVDNTAQLSFPGRLGYALTVQFLYNSSSLRTITATSDSVSVTCPKSWFTSAGVSGSTMRISISVSDGSGRTASGELNLINPQGSTATPTAPKNTSAEGSEQITFSWTVSSDWGAQTKAELQWSTDNAEWAALGTVTGSGTTYKAAAKKFPPGTIYWRVRVTNEYGIVGAWSSSVSFTAAYAAQSQAVAVNSPTGGRIDASVAQTFSVSLQTTGTPYTPFTISAATFYWREAGGSYTSLSMSSSGQSASVTVPANTFPSGSIQWYASATDNTGRTTQTEVYTLSTLAGAVTATPLAPVGTVESGGGTITFRWAYESADGSSQRSANLQFSTDGETWGNTATVLGIGTSYTAQSSAFAPGSVYWRVRATSAQSVTSQWSDAVSFILRGAPVISSVSTDGRPKLTVSWQLIGQQLAYQLDIDGRLYGPYFGANVRRRQLQDHLADGVYTVRVRAQNEYGLWSEWKETTASVSNNPSGGLWLSGDFGADAALSWGLIPRPAITQQPQDVSTDAEFIGVAIETEGPDVTYAWEYRVTQNGRWYAFRSVNDSIPAFMFKFSDNVSWAEIRCKVSGFAGTVVSQSAIYTRLEAPTETPPVILLQPQDVTANGSSTQFDAVASDSAEMAWYYKLPQVSDQFVRLSGNRRSLAFTPSPGLSGMQVFFRATNAAGSVDSDVATFTWGEPEPLPEPQPTAQDTTPTLVYRDGERIGSSSDGSFVDRTAIGAHVWTLIKPLADGYCLRSNIVAGELFSSEPMIAALEGGAWISLKLSKDQYRELSFSEARDVTWTRYSGAEFPEAEVGEGKDVRASFTVDWPHAKRADALRFEALIGRPVIYKAQDRIVIGVLEGYSLSRGVFFRSYSCSLRQMDRREIADA